MSLPWLVIGSAACVFEDLKLLPAYGNVVLVNQAMDSFRFPGAVGATIHHEMAAGWARPGLHITSIRPDPGVDEAWEEEKWKHGSSGLYGIGLALRRGAEQILLAGIPMDDTPHHYDDSGLVPFVDAYRAAWLRIENDLRGRVTSMSGWTRDLLNT